MKTYLLNRIEQRFCRLNGIRHSSQQPQKAQLCQSFGDHMIYSSDQLPPKVDLRSHMTTIEDQSTIGSCVANTLAGAYEYLIKRSTNEHVDVSRLFIYYNARSDDNPSGELTDSGCSMTSGIEALEKYGVCLESSWPYQIETLNYRPDDGAYEQATAYRIEEALRVDLDITQMKSCLAQGYPFAFGLSLFNSFDKASKTGIVPLPDPSEQSRKAHGSHAMLAVGYSDQSNSFIVRNSWGQYWGDHGYCYIPYEYMTNPQLCFDLWTIRQIANDDFGQDDWDQDDSVDLHPNDQIPPDDNDDEHGGASIEKYTNDDDVFQDMKKFAGGLLNTFISLAF